MNPASVINSSHDSKFKIEIKDQIEIVHRFKLQTTNITYRRMLPERPEKYDGQDGCAMNAHV
jgi:hypothetical protein